MVNLYSLAYGAAIGASVGLVFVFGGGVLTAAALAAGAKTTVAMMASAGAVAAFACDPV